jgi:hypothetical protein
MGSAREEALQLLLEAISEVEEGWAKHFWSRHTSEIEERVYGRKPAKLVCAHGALSNACNRVSPYGCAGGAIAFHTMWNIVGPSIAGWNDSPSTTKAVVLEAMSTAIASAIMGVITERLQVQF